LTTADWSNSTILSGDLAEEITQLKQQDGGDILVGGSISLVRGLTDLGLVDEYRLMTFPIALGEGKRLFEGISDAVTLSLADVKPLKTGTVILTYQRA
jgi:dihydrofolate reductase